MSKRLAVALGVVVLAVMTGGLISGSSAASGRTIRAVGRNSFVRNALIQSTYRFAPGRFVVSSGARITLSSKATKEPHTWSIVKRKQRPGNVQEVFGCRVCGKFRKPKINAGKPGYNRAGDSRFVPPGKTVKVKITADAGRTLYYICAIHPWMQGKIVVQ